VTLSPDIRHTIAAHTAGLPVRERLIRAKGLIQKYHITDKGDIGYVAYIAAVPESEL